MSNPLEDNVQQSSLAPNMERITGIDFTPLNTPTPTPDGPTSGVPSNVNEIGANILTIGADSPQIVIAPNYNMFTSTVAPDNANGNDGDWFWMITSGGVVRVYQKQACLWALITQTPGGLGCPDGCPAGGDLKGEYLNPLVQNVHHNGNDGAITIQDSAFTFAPIDLGNNTTTINIDGILMTNGDGHQIGLNAASGPQLFVYNNGDQSEIFLSPGNDWLKIQANGSGNVYTQLSANTLLLHDIGVGDVVLNNNSLTIDTIDGSSAQYSSNIAVVSDGATGALIELDPAGDGIYYGYGGKNFEVQGTLLTQSMSIKEIDVCVAGVAKKMLVIASDPY